MARKTKPTLFPEAAEIGPPTDKLERRYRDDGYRVVAGVDEVGRGPLAGPVVAAAVVLPDSIAPGSKLRSARDSKVMTPEQREIMYKVIVEQAVQVSWAFCDNGEIDTINILAASLEAMKRAIYFMDPVPDLLLVDGDHPVPCRIPSITVVKGDSLSLSIASASIIAKVVRDRMMEGYSRLYPVYGFDSHKGYGCISHRKAIYQHGPCPLHRMSFRTLKELVDEEN